MCIGRDRPNIRRCAVADAAATHDRRRASSSNDSRPSRDINGKRRNRPTAGSNSQTRTPAPAPPHLKGASRPDCRLLPQTRTRKTGKAVGHDQCGNTRIISARHRGAPPTPSPALRARATPRGQLCPEKRRPATPALKDGKGK